MVALVFEPSPSATSLMRVHRLIFRLDFKSPSFDIIDSPGTVMRILSDMGEKYWPEFQDATATRTISGAADLKDQGTYRRISVEPTNLNFVLESSTGIPIRTLLEDATVSTLFKGIHELTGRFGIRDVERAGIRLLVLGSINEGKPLKKDSLGCFFDRKLIACVTSQLGSIDDVGFSVDGEGSDKLKYHFRFGPYADDDLVKQQLKPNIAESIKSSGITRNVMFDLDLYENKFALSVTPQKWALGPKERVEKLVAEFEPLLSERL